MKPRVTYREITLVIGIMVALLVAFTFWVTQTDPNSASTVSLPQTFQTASLRLINSFINIWF